MEVWSQTEVKTARSVTGGAGGRVVRSQTKEASRTNADVF